MTRHHHHKPRACCRPDGRPSARPAVTRTGAGRRGRWALVAPFKVCDGARVVVLPAGMTSDLASVPRVLWLWRAPWEFSLAAPLVHDALYRGHGMLPVGGVQPFHRYTRAEADALFYTIMRREGVPRVAAGLAWAAVRVFGWFAWRKP